MRRALKLAGRAWAECEGTHPVAHARTLLDLLDRLDATQLWPFLPLPDQVVAAYVCRAFALSIESSLACQLSLRAASSVRLSDSMGADTRATAFKAQPMPR